MWVFTNTGFVSAVQDSTNRTIIVRARDKKSLEPISEKSKAPIKKTPHSDYPYRVLVAREVFAEWLYESAQSINYGNFKSEVSNIRGHNFSKPLMKVWSAMHDVEDSQARSK